MIPPP
ncbi:hypothetical protein ECPA39_2937, partial [Escherichia coli PA39]